MIKAVETLQPLTVTAVYALCFVSGIILPTSSTIVHATGFRIYFFFKSRKKKKREKKISYVMAVYHWCCIGSKFVAKSSDCIRQPLFYLLTVLVLTRIISKSFESLRNNLISEANAPDTYTCASPSTALALPVLPVKRQARAMVYDILPPSRNVPELK